jgi:hypothetical protein
MKKSEKITRWILVCLVALALVAVILQIVNDKTGAIETIYEIITFTVALAAVILAVLQGLANARTTRDMAKLTAEIRELVRDVERDGRRDADLEHVIKQDMELDRQEIELINQELHEKLTAERLARHSKN